MRAIAWILISFSIVSIGCGEPDGDEQPALVVPDVDQLLGELEGLPLEELLEASFRAELRRDPEAAVEIGMAAELGVPDDALTPISVEHVREDLRLLEGIAALLDARDPSALSQDDRLSFQTYRAYLQDRIDQRPFLLHDYPVSHFINGAQVDLEFFFTDVHPLRNEAEARAYVARLRRVGQKMEQIIEQVDAHEEAGVVLPSFLIDWSLDGIDRLAESAPESVSFYSTFAARLPELEASVREELLDQAAAAVADRVIPAYQALGDRMRAQLAVAPGAVGVGTLPDGAAYYAYALEHHTTTALTADQIHEMGMTMLADVKQSMRARFADLGYDTQGSLQTLFRRVVEEGGVVPEAEVGATFEEIIRDAESRLEPAFDLRASAPWSVKVFPSGGFYVPASLDGDRPGVFYATDRPTPRFGMRTLAYHEVMPGHHFQISIAQEHATTLFRRIFFHTAYAEGWGLYAERLASELGWYDDDPYGDLGRLQAAAFRAVRLVVDTGIHARGWSYDEAVDFMVENAGFERGSSEWEVSRYAAWPGQATAYAIGMSELVRMREESRARLGAAFDLRAFHRKVLVSGSLPLPQLDQIVRDD